MKTSGLFSTVFFSGVVVGELKYSLRPVPISSRLLPFNFLLESS